MCKSGRTVDVVAMPYFSRQLGLNSSRRHEFPTWRVLLDSSSNGDLLCQKKDSKSKNESVTYIIRTIPQLWYTSHGIFHTEKRSECEISFEDVLLKGSLYDQILSNGIQKKVNPSLT